MELKWNLCDLEKAENVFVDIFTFPLIPYNIMWTSVIFEMEK